MKKITQILALVLLFATSLYASNFDISKVSSFLGSVSGSDTDGNYTYLTQNSSLVILDTTLFYK